jgi:hypothetical protein
MFTRIPSYQQCVVVCAIARHGGSMTAGELHDVKAYATNIVAALLDRGFVEPNPPDIWKLTASGRELAREFLGELPAGVQP